MLSLLARSILRLFRWKLLGANSPEMRSVVVAAPHTSNWDFIYFILAAWALKVPVRWMGKKEMFPLPVGWLFKKMGGIPIDRGSPGAVVSQMVTAFESGKPMAVVLTPEATRKRVDHWKSGFYRIAIGAGVPIVFGILNVERRELGMVPGFMPTGNLAADMDLMREFYSGVEGIRPGKFGPVRLKSEGAIVGAVGKPPPSKAE